MQAVLLCALPSGVFQKFHPSCLGWKTADSLTIIFHANLSEQMNQGTIIRIPHLPQFLSSTKVEDCDKGWEPEDLLLWSHSPVLSAAEGSWINTDILLLSMHSCLENNQGKSEGGIHALCSPPQIADSHRIAIESLKNVDFIGWYPRHRKALRNMGLIKWQLASMIAI